LGFAGKVVAVEIRSKPSFHDAICQRRGKPLFSQRREGRPDSDRWAIKLSGQM